MQTPAAGQFLPRDVCGGYPLHETKTVSSVQLHVKSRREHVEEEEPLPDDVSSSTPTLDVFEKTSPVATLLSNVTPRGKDLSNITLVAPPGKDSSSKHIASASLHPEAVAQGGQSYPGQAPSVGRALEYAADVRKAGMDVVLPIATQKDTWLLLKFKQVSMLLRDHILFRLQHWHKLETNMGQQRSAAGIIVLVGAGVGIIIILILMFAVLNCAQAGGRHSAQSDSARSGHGRGFRELSQKGSVSKLATPALLSVSTPTQQSLLTPKDLSPVSTKRQGLEGAGEYFELYSDLCRDLVVPDGCDCVVKVPKATLSQGPFRITDPNDNIVLYVEPCALNARPSIVPGSTDAELRLQHGLDLRHEDGTIAAQCRPSLTQAGECEVLRATGDHFAKITGTEEKAYTLMTCTGLKLYFLGSMENEIMKVLDHSGRIVATTGSIFEIPASGETSSVAAYQDLRIGPLMDMGLVVCGFVCIQHMM